MVANAVPGFLPSIHGLGFANAFPPGPTLRLGRFDARMLGFGDASAGLCGGMALTARDRFEAGLSAPALAGLPAPAEPRAPAEPPANGSPAFRALVRRQVQSLDWLRVPLRYFDLQAFRPDPPVGLAACLGREPPRVIAFRDEWPRIRAEIDGGHPCVVGLIRTSGSNPWRLTANHQVLAFGYETSDGAITIRVYDPNHPGRDDVELRATVEASPPPAMPAATPVAPSAGGASVGTDRPWRDRIRLVQSTGEPLLGFFRQPYPTPRTVRSGR